MSMETNWSNAAHYLDRAAKTLDGIGDGAPVDVVAEVGLGYALLALMDEIEALRKRLAGESGA